MDTCLVIDKACCVECTKSIPGDQQTNVFCHIPLMYYLSVSSAGIALQVTKVTGGVLQTEASLVTLCYFTASADLQQIIMAELIHTVVVPGRTSERLGM